MVKDDALKLTKDEYREMLDTMIHLEEAMNKVFQILHDNGVRLTPIIGYHDGGAGAPHLHVHLVALENGESHEG